jgi:hypothetical protein
MAAIQVDDRSRHWVARSFYLIMAFVLTALVVLGFSNTVPSDFTAPGFPIFLWVHGAVFTTWMLLFVAQPALILRGSLTLHRTLGWFGAVLALAMVGLALVAILAALLSDHVPPFYPHRLFLIRGVMGISVFAGLVIGGIAQRKRGEWHKRLMLCASIVVIAPGLERALPIPAMGPNWPYMTDALIMVLALVGPAVDLIVRRRIHPAYLWGVGAILVGQLIVDVLAPSPLAPLLLHLIGAH